MEWLTQSQSGYRRASSYLFGMRVSVVFMQLVALVITRAVAPDFYSITALWVCLLYSLFAAASYLWFVRRPPTAAWIVAISLIADLLFIAAWLFPTGGYANPLTSLLLLPIAVGIVLLPLGQGIGLALIGVVAYGLQIRWPDGAAEGGHGGHLAQLHLVGMGVAFALTAAILVLVVGALARQVREQQAQLASTREARLRDEQVIALGLSAATVAHRLGTPLNTMTLLVEEMRSDGQQESLTDDLDLLEQQLALCTGHLRHLADAARQVQAASTEDVTLSAWMGRLKESATLLWPSAAIDWQTSVPSPLIAVDATLDQAVLNLIANALLASPDWVSVKAREVGLAAVEIVVQDRGNGSKLLEESGIGDSVVSSEQGLGVGLLLSNATIQRLGGTLKARSSAAGTTMIIELPRVREAEEG